MPDGRPSFLRRNGLILLSAVILVLSFVGLAIYGKLHIEHDSASGPGQAVTFRASWRAVHVHARDWRGGAHDGLSFEYFVVSSWHGLPDEKSRMLVEVIPHFGDIFYLRPADN